MEHKAVQEVRPQWAVGDTVWYSPGTSGLLFMAVIKKAPWKLIGLWVVGVGDLPSGYRVFIGMTHPAVVVATTDSPQTIYARDPNDERSWIHWNQFKNQRRAESGKMKHVVEEGKESTDS